MKFDKNNIRWVKGYYGLPEAYYKINIPSVTSVLSSIPDPELEQWMISVGEDKANEIMKNAAYRGTAMHLFIEKFVNEYSTSKDVSGALIKTQSETPILLEKDGVPVEKINEGRDLFYKFYYSEYPIEYTDLIGSELPIYSKKLFFRGKADVFFKSRVFGPKVTDFKTSNGYIKKGSVKEYKYKCQLGGYALALDEMLSDKSIIVNSASILCVNTKSNSLQEVECSGSELKTFKETFKTLVTDWHKNNDQEFLLK